MPKIIGSHERDDDQDHINDKKDDLEREIFIFAEKGFHLVIRDWRLETWGLYEIQFKILTSYLGRERFFDLPFESDLLNPRSIFPMVSSCVKRSFPISLPR